MKFGFETDQDSKKISTESRLASSFVISLELSLEQIPCDLINEKEHEILGMSASTNETFLACCLRFIS